MGRVTACFGAALLFCATVVWVFDAQGGEYEQGKALYEQHCTICHGADGKGNGPAAASFSPHPTDFTRAQFWQGEVDKKITDTILKGRNPMPAFSMGASEITDIINYMKKDFGK